jgi:hypothetical protein
VSSMTLTAGEILLSFQFHSGSSLWACWKSGLRVCEVEGWNAAAASILC